MLKKNPVNNISTVSASGVLDYETDKSNVSVEHFQQFSQKFVVIKFTKGL